MLEFLARYVCCGLPIGLVALFLISKKLLIRADNQNKAKGTRQRAAIPESEFHRVIDIVEGLGTEPPTVALLARLGRPALDQPNLIRLPNNLQNFPWRGRCISVVRREDAAWEEFSFVESDEQGIVLFGETYRAVGVPRVTKKSGKIGNIFDLTRIYKMAPGLAEERPACAPYSAEAFFSEVFPTHEGGQIGGSPYWIQGPETLHCTICKRPMRLIVQLSSRELKNPVGDDEMVYFFGCNTHPGETETTQQMY